MRNAFPLIFPVGHGRKSRGFAICPAQVSPLVNGIMAQPNLKSMTWIAALGALAIIFISVSIETRLRSNRLNSYIGRSVGEVVQEMRLEDANQSWVDEPPGVLHGRHYALPDNTEATLYLDRPEAMFRQFSERGEWDEETFRQAKVGGIQYRFGELTSGWTLPFRYWQRPWGLTLSSTGLARVSLECGRLHPFVGARQNCWGP